MVRTGWASPTRGVHVSQATGIAPGLRQVADLPFQVTEPMPHSEAATSPGLIA